MNLLFLILLVCSICASAEGVVMGKWSKRSCLALTIDISVLVAQWLAVAL